jgi:regulator of nucleoside diphosphate kinase
MKSPVITADDFRRLRAMIRAARRSPRKGGYLNALERELRRATLVTPRGVPRDTVTMNSRVRVLDVEAGEPKVLTVAYPHHDRPEQAGVSVLTPLGTALLGKRVGDVVFHKGEEGVQKLKVEEVLYQPETAGDLHL